jgi:hypothetical protein
MSALGQKRTLEHVSLMSALPPKADIPDTRLAEPQDGKGAPSFLRRMTQLFTKTAMLNS